MLLSYLIAVVPLVVPALSYTWPDPLMDELEHLLVDTGGPDDGGIKAVGDIHTSVSSQTYTDGYHPWIPIALGEF